MKLGIGLELLRENDLFFNGDLQKWKKLANTLKLRMGLRAQGASGADFASSAISEALQNPLLSTAEDNALMEKDMKLISSEMPPMVISGIISEDLVLNGKLVKR